VGKKEGEKKEGAKSYPPPSDSPLALAWAVSGELAGCAGTSIHSIEPNEALTLGL